MKDAALAQRRCVLIAIGGWAAVMMFILVPKVALGESSLMHAWDFLDSFHAWNVILSRTGMMFALPNALVPTVFDTGLQRVSFGPQFSLFGMLYLAFPPYWATVVAEILARAIGFWGMYRLVNFQLLRHRDDRTLIAVVAATSFSLINYMPGTFLSIIGLPLLVSALFAIATNTAKTFDFGYIVLFPFASYLALVGVFLVPVVGIASLVVLAFGQRHMAVRLILSAAVLTIGYLVSDYGIIAMKLFGSFETQRSGREVVSLAFGNAVWLSAKAFLTGTYHANPGIAPWVITLSLLGAAVEWLNAVFRPRSGTPSPQTSAVDRLKDFPINICLAAISLLCVLSFMPYALLKWMPFLSFIAQIDVRRWLWLTPPIYYLAFGLSVAQLLSIILSRKKATSTILVALLVIPQFVILFLVSDSATRLLARYASAAKFGDMDWLPAKISHRLSSLYADERIGLTYHEYYSPELFDKIEKIIGRPRGDVRVGTIGADPFIANYNGFSITEGYFQIIDKSYQQRLVSVEKGELETSRELRNYMLGWGNRAYLFSSELFRNSQGCRVSCLADRAPRSIELAYNGEALRALNIDALISVSQIENADDLGLEFIGFAEEKSSPWRFFIYRVRVPVGALPFATIHNIELQH